MKSILQSIQKNTTYPQSKYTINNMADDNNDFCASRTTTTTYGECRYFMGCFRYFSWNEWIVFCVNSPPPIHFCRPYSLQLAHNWLFHSTLLYSIFIINDDDDIDKVIVCTCADVFVNNNNKSDRMMKVSMKFSRLNFTRSNILQEMRKVFFYNPN